MRFAICEDQADHADILEEYVRRWSNLRGIRADIVRYLNAEEFLMKWEDDNTFDVAFLDIDMGRMNGMELAKRIRRQDQAMLIIFASGLKDYVFRAYDVQAFRFLLKPIKEKDCFQTLDCALIAVENKKKDTFIVQQEAQSIKLFLNDIIYLRMDNHYISICTTQSEIRYKEKISTVETQLREPHFCRCHRSYLVNLHHVNTINREMVRMDNGECLPVSRKRWTALNECFIGYYNRKI